MAKILSPIEHIVVVMLEDRSFDKMVGTLYADGSSPSQLLPAGSANGSAGYISGSPEGKGPGRLTEQRSISDSIPYISMKTSSPAYRQI
jgi:phospholipase C